MNDEGVEINGMALNFILKLICERTEDLKYSCLYDESVIDLEVLGYIYQILLKKEGVV